jgi:hypothetical protein
LSNALSIRNAVRAWRRRAPANTAHWLALHAAFMTVIVASFFYTREPPPPPQWISLSGAGGSPGIGSAGAPGTVGAGLTIDADDLVAKFAETRVGQVLYAPQVGDRCRRLLFDNNRGSLFETSPMTCVQPIPDPSASVTTDRLLAVRKQFQK